MTSSAPLPTLKSIQDKIKGMEFNSEDLQIEAAREFIRHYAMSIKNRLGNEVIDLQDCLGRILAEDIISPINVPPADNSAMDGYAFNSAALNNPSNEVTLKVKGVILAGSFDTSQLSDFNLKEDTLRIMTGAVIPLTCDTVIPQELVKASADGVTFSRESIKAHANVRNKGEDLSEGHPALNAGRLITPSDLGLIASLGIGQVTVKQRLKVAIFSTGNEIHPVGIPLKPGGIYDSNRYTLLGMLTRLGVEIIDMGIVKDDPIELKNILSVAANKADVIITSGGVSVGQADFTKQVLDELGDVAFWKLAIKPGRPMAFGKITSNGREAILFGLPGNPVAVMVTFYQFVKGALLQMSGSSGTGPALLNAHLSSDLKKRPGRTEFIRAKLHRDNQGTLWATPTGNQGSGILRSMSEADCFIILGHEQSNVSQGSIIDIATFEGLI